MEKNRIHMVHDGRASRVSYARDKDVLSMPNLVEVQRNSYQWLLDEGLAEVFEGISPIEDFAGKMSLEFLSYRYCEEETNHTIEECKETDATYSAPLRVQVRLHNLETGSFIDEEIFFGDLPLMTKTGTFVINGAERVIVSQLVRSPGIYYGKSLNEKKGKDSFKAQVIPYRGAWLEYETDHNDILYVRVDKKSKTPITIFVRALSQIDLDFLPKSSLVEALGDGTEEDIVKLFGEEEMLSQTFVKDKVTTNAKGKEDGLSEGKLGLLELYHKVKPGEPDSIENAQSTIKSMLFDHKRYDLARVGRYKFNKKLSFKGRIVGFVLTEDVCDPTTGEILYEKGTVVTDEIAIDIQNAAVPFVWVQTETKNTKVISNLMVDINTYVDFDCTPLGVNEQVFYPVLEQILEEYDEEDDIKEAIRKNISLLIPKFVTIEDIIASVNYILNLENGVGKVDDIDHLGNRRIRAVGELLQNQYRIGLSRMEKTIKTAMDKDSDNMTIHSLLNINPIKAAIKEFFGSSQLSQFMDQNNPLAELTHKRRLSALGPGGLTRDRAGFEVRDVHYTHYGRMCPIETPEGPNIGLINSFASYARLNEYGFIEAPYRKVDKSNPDKPVVLDEVVYITADEEDKYVVAQANEPLDEKGHFVNEYVSGRCREEISQFDKRDIDFMDVSPRMVFSVATSMIPFLQNDDANRALMGSNMQRQAVPLMVTEAPVIGTGIESKVAKDSGVCVMAERAGIVEKVQSDEIVIKADNGETDTYKLIKYSRSNQDNCYNQKPIVDKGDRVEEGEVIADGASTCNGEIALGKNPLIGFMTWEGYNYEDAVLLSEKLVQNDVYTSIHIKKYDIQVRNTKIGKEAITNDIPGLSADALSKLGSDGIIRIGAEVRAGDILVGKVTPKGETDPSNAEKLLYEIFGEKTREVRDTSLRVPHGEYGVVVDVKKFSKSETTDKNTEQVVRVYVAQKRKISVGDKMAGRHGNKGVVSRVLPVEDMPFLPNGRPLDIVLNPLGVPSRMNIGQVLETHMSLAAKALGMNISTPVFDGADENDILDTLDLANDYVNTDWEEFEAKYKDVLDDEVMTYLYDNRDHRELWKGVPITRDGKVQLRDGRTGEPFDGLVTVGHMHYLKLHHLVDDKMHARSTGPYALVTQQPLGGKAQFGGQRFGEMEVWALEAYGASYTLQEILTVKSDDMNGRVKTYDAIVNGHNIPQAGIPESFRVLIKECQALGLDMKLLDKDDNEVEIKDDVPTNVNRFNNDRVRLEETGSQVEDVRLNTTISE